MSDPGAGRVVLAHPGNPPFARQAARALLEAGLLERYVTSLAYRPHDSVSRLLRAALRLRGVDPEALLARRVTCGIPEEMIAAHPLPELVRLGASRVVNPVALDRIWEVTETWFDRIVSRRHVRSAVAVYGYEHAALAMFRAAERRGAFRLYEQPIAHHTVASEILEPELAAFPQLETPLEAHLRRQAPRRNARKDEELSLADAIIVGSSFTKNSLLRAGIPAECVTVVPFGSPPVVHNVAGSRPSPIVFLSAGQQSVRKGTHHLLQAWRRLRPPTGCELWLVGAMRLPRELVANLPGSVKIHASLPPDQLATVYAQASVLVFPSLLEGFGLVITEAMAHGLAVIASDRTAAPDILDHGVNGCIVPAGDVDRLVETMQWCLDHPGDVREMGCRAAETAAAWQWKDYRARHARTVAGFLGRA